ncbi:unnamed protein product, partial [Anisakis simplex]|uniref:Tudor domain-containing protein n=1 Tax=Anisakis simplex TaxID=6269 RepID=A0A0M3K582_ANISI
IISYRHHIQKNIWIVAVKASPSNGEYEAIITYDQHLPIVASEVSRIDKYGHQGDCALEPSTRPLCYCLENLKKNEAKKTSTKKTSSTKKRVMKSKKLSTKATKTRTQKEKARKQKKS